MDFSSRNSQSVGREFHHTCWVVPLWIFPALQFYTSLLMARDTCNQHTPGTQFVVSQQFSWTWSWNKQSYRRVLHNKVRSSHRPGALPAAAAQTTGTKIKWHNSCTSLQNYLDLTASLLLVFNDMSRELAKIQDRAEPSSGNTETLGCKCIIPSTDYHFVPGSTLRPTHTERVLKSTTSSV